MRRLIYLPCLVYLLLFILLIQAAYAKETNENDDETAFKDFTLNIGDRIDLGDYQMELIEIQSVRDGLVVMRVSKIGGSLDEQRALLQDSANNFDGGSENGGVTVTVADIFDEQSAKVRIEYQQSLGTPRKRASERPAAALDKPELSVQKNFDRNQLSVGDEVKVTITVKNVGTGQALGIKAEDIPPLPEFSYVAGYPPKIKETLDSGQSDSAIYVMNAVKEGSIRVPAILVSYTDTKKNAKSNSSVPFNILISPKGKADLAIKLACYAPIALDGEGMLNISISNLGAVSATRIEADGTVMPSEGLQVTGLEKSFFEILPGAEVNYSARLSGQKPGNYTVRLKVSYDAGAGSVIQEAAGEVVVLEREYKYQYLLLIIPIAIIIAWMYRRYREYKY
ncbi:MAG: BatD family protein [Methanothrix sp.]|nr:BatD family protein [Methanothrix sp.]